MHRQGKKLQIRNFKRRFHSLNPTEDSADVDFYAFVAEGFEYWENLTFLEKAFPQFNWNYIWEIDSIAQAEEEEKKRTKTAATTELLLSYPCFGKLCGPIVHYSEECAFCTLAERCQKTSAFLDYTGMYLCPSCGTKNTNINLQTAVEFNFGFEATIRCANCEWCTETIPFDGAEQKQRLPEPQCNAYSTLWYVNSKADVRYGKNLTILVKCKTRCTSSQIIKCLFTLTAQRFQAKPKKTAEKPHETIVATDIAVANCLHFKDFGKLFTPELGVPKVCFLCDDVLSCLTKYLKAASVNLTTPQEVVVECEQFPVILDDEDEPCEGCSKIMFCEECFKNGFVQPDNPDQCQQFFDYRYFGNGKVTMAKHCHKCCFNAYCRKKCINNNERERPC